MFELISAFQNHSDNKLRQIRVMHWRVKGERIYDVRIKIRPWQPLLLLPPTRMQIDLSYQSHKNPPDTEYRNGIFSHVRSPGIDSKEWIPPTYVAWRAGTITLFLLGSLPPLLLKNSSSGNRLPRLEEFIPWNRYLGSINGTTTWFLAPPLKCKWKLENPP
jgi:hypothetical protein